MSSTISVEKYLKADLFEELGLNNLEQGEKEAFLASFGEVIQKRITLRLLQELGDSQKDKLEALLAGSANDGGVALGNFLKAEVPNLEAIVGEEVAKYKKTIIDRVKA